MPKPYSYQTNRYDEEWKDKLLTFNGNPITYDENDNITYTIQAYTLYMNMCSYVHI